MDRHAAAKNNWRDRSLFRYDGHSRKAGIGKRKRRARSRSLRRRWRAGLNGADYSHDGPRPPHPQP